MEGVFPVGIVEPFPWHHRLEVGWLFGTAKPLHGCKIGDTVGANVAIAPVLDGGPLDEVIEVLRHLFGKMLKAGAFGIICRAAVGDYQDIAMGYPIDGIGVFPRCPFRHHDVAGVGNAGVVGIGGDKILAVGGEGNHHGVSARVGGGRIRRL